MSFYKILYELKIFYLKFCYMKISDMKDQSTVYLSLYCFISETKVIVYVCRIVKAVRSLLMLIPTDTKVLEELDRLTQVLTYTSLI